MKLIRDILAWVCGVAVFATATFSGIFSEKMRVVYYDLSRGGLPLSSRMFLSFPLHGYIGLGLILGGILVWAINKTEPPWASFPITAVVGFLVLAYLGLFSASLLRPFFITVSGLDLNETNAVEQAESTAPSESNTTSNVMPSASFMSP